MVDLSSDRGQASQLATSLKGIHFPDAKPVPRPSVSNISAMVAGASLNDNLKSALTELKKVTDIEATNLEKIAGVFVQVDASLAKGIQ